MSTSSLTQVAVAAALCAALASSSLAADEPLVLRVARRAMGTEFEVVLWGDDRAELQAAAEEALDEVERLDQQLSLYIESSDLNWINGRAAREPVRAEAGLFDLLRTAARLHRDTEGAFDITVAPLVKCWGFFRGQGKPASREAVEQALSHTGMRHVVLDEAHRTVRFDEEGITLDLGGIAKGYAVERAANMLRRFGVKGALLHGGQSTIYALGSAPDGEPWTVGLQDPRDAARRLMTVELRDEALSSSGSYDEFIEVDGHIYSHIIDPRSGWPAEGLLSASVVTRSATEADALSTAFFVLGVEGTRRYCANHADVRAILVPAPPAGQQPRPVIIGGQP